MWSVMTLTGCDLGRWRRVGGMGPSIRSNEHLED
jgi:hypothetical protein